MNYGSIGSLTEQRPGSYEFAYAKEIFSAFCLSGKSKLHGLYYPCPQDKTDKAYEHATLKHDFLITPIPPELWRVSARMHIYLQNTPGTLNELCKFLKENRISIIHSESTRSAFRYATWSLHIVFEDLLSEGQVLNYDKQLSCYKETKSTLDDFIRKFESEKSKHLYKPPERSAIKGDPNYTLAYFDDYRKSHAENPLCKPFTLSVQDQDKIHQRHRLLGDTTFSDIISHLVKDEDPTLLPATTFSEIDTNELNLRTILIPQSDAKRFSKVSLKYKGDKNIGVNNDSIITHVGMMEYITSRMPPQFNIWHAYDRTMDYKPSEKGEIVFLIENITKFLMQDSSQIQDIKGRLAKDYRDETNYQAEVISTFESIKKQCAEDKKETYEFDELVVAKLPLPSVVNKIFLQDDKDVDFDFDVFISYSQQDKKMDEEEKTGKNLIRKLIDTLNEKEIAFYMDTREIKSGDRIDESIMNNIRKSREMCIIISPNSASSEWMTIERGAAAVLGKKITLYLINKDTKLPAEFSTTLFVAAYKDLDAEKYANEIIERRDKYLANKYRRKFLR